MKENNVILTCILALWCFSLFMDYSVSNPAEIYIFVIITCVLATDKQISCK